MIDFKFLNVAIINHEPHNNYLLLIINISLFSNFLLFRYCFTQFPHPLTVSFTLFFSYLMLFNGNCVNVLLMYHHSPQFIYSYFKDNYYLLSGE